MSIDMKLHRIAATNEVEELCDEIDTLREFAAYVMAQVWEHAEDDGSIQDKAEWLGLIELRPISSEYSIDGEAEHYFLAWSQR